MSCLGKVIHLFYIDPISTVVSRQNIICGLLLHMKCVGLSVCVSVGLLATSPAKDQV